MCVIGGIEVLGQDRCAAPPLILAHISCEHNVTFAAKLLPLKGFVLAVSAEAFAVAACHVIKEALHFHGGLVVLQRDQRCLKCFLSHLRQPIFIISSKISFAVHADRDQIRYDGNGKADSKQT